MGEGPSRNGRQRTGGQNLECPVLVVGGGIGGLAAAIRLACGTGHRVVLLERNSSVGGKMSQSRLAGFRWDDGPSVLTLPDALDELFCGTGEVRQDWIPLQPLDAAVRCFFHDGDQLDIRADPNLMTEQLAAIDPRDVAGYEQYLAYTKRLWEATNEVFVFDRAPTWRQVLAPATWPRLWKADPFRTMSASISSYLKSKKLQAVVERFATYVGASPLRAPGTLNVIGHVELNTGVYYPIGGMYRVAEALERLAKQCGVEIWTDTQVAEFIVADSTRPQVTGVRLTGGRVLDARAIVFNGDITVAYQSLIPATIARRGRRMIRPPSASAFILQLGIQGEFPQLLHHNMLYSADYHREFRQIFDEHRPPDEPSLYLAITCKTDADHAPAGCENWFVLALAPPLSTKDGFIWDEGTTRSYREVVLRRLADHGFDVRSRLVAERIWTPPIHAAHTDCFAGGLFGSTSNEWLSAMRRPPNRDPYIKRLYYAGASAHPGAGVPMVLLSAKRAVTELLEDGLG